MSWTGFAVVVTGALLLWRLVMDYIPLFPLNDLSRKSVMSHSRDWTAHYVPLGLAMLLNMSPFPLAIGVGLVISCLYVVLQAVTCWLPYWTGSSDNQKERYEQAYGRTHRFLPRIRDHLVPDTQHVITGVLAVIMVVGTLGHLLAAGGHEPSAASKEALALSGSASAAEAQKIETAFTQAGQKPEELLIKAIGEAKTSLDIAINAINHDGIVSAIIDARIRGVYVRVITDRSEAGNAAQAEKLRSLADSGIPVRENTRKGLMDLKMSLIDDYTAVTGSFNYTVNASTVNDEMLVIVRDSNVVKEWKERFEAMWGDTQNFREWKTAAAKK
jgi:phosphatidylserine/phosphatidylglycerophosphate/cardiolipin synthase-like enzyme